ncbi:MAG: CPBP family intramembrane metalloprotease [Candidatus Diapherotrites archaeon]|uniref:CPBP family intramembrane metalloprotease n=1 Tax=Candidatus Iainarchaeum sp. TaxID=3101447 RepID=A0A938YRN9_9ARCH|nr:CPBP family intramembrane metalloprotease [Candidatus Diapherotrites archaeon]
MLERLASNALIDLFLIGIPIAFLFIKKKREKQALSAKETARELGLSGIELKSFLKKTALLLAALVIAALFLDFLLTAFSVNDSQNIAAEIAGLKAVPLLLFYLLSARVLSEEIFFRGFLVKRAGVVVSALLFAAMHFGYGSHAEIAGAFILGVILGKAFQLNKNLYPNIAAHIAYNAIAISMIFWSV